VTTLPLAERLRAETRTLHVAAERSPFMATLLRGRMDRAAYAALLDNLEAIYAALEPALARHAAHPALAPLGLEALSRVGTLRHDLAAVRPAGIPAGTLAPTTSRYVERVRRLEAAEPERLLAHAYVRYLGDLSGGQLLQRIVAESMDLPTGSGTSFYDFGDAAATAELARRFRAGLAAAVVDDADAVVDEARLAFEWHRTLFDELAATFGIAGTERPTDPGPADRS
jgi:heme oxygenase